MLQIDQNELQVYSCSFLLTIGCAQIPLKVRGHYYIEWKIKNASSGVKSAFHDSNIVDFAAFKQSLKLHTEILYHRQAKSFLKKYTQLTLYLLSSRQPQSPKIVGSMLIGLHQVLNNKKYSEMKNYRFNLSFLNVDLQFKCLCTECNHSSLLEANLNAALKVDEDFLMCGDNTFSRFTSTQKKIVLLEKMTKQFLQENEEINQEDCQFIQPDFQDIVNDYQNSSKDHQICKKQNQSLKQQLSLQKQLNGQLMQNYKRLENRMQIVKDWELERSTLIAKIKQLQGECSRLKVKCQNLQKKVQLIGEEHKPIVNDLKVTNQELNYQLTRRDNIILLYQEKMSKFQYQISLMQQDEFTHRAQYSSSIAQVKQLSPKKSENSNKKLKTSMINVEYENQDLKQIQQEDIEQSYISGLGEKEITTYAELPQNNQEDFYRKMAKNVQEQLDQLRVIYHDKETVILRQKAISKNLFEELQRLRFEFVYELSKVASSLNQKIFQIRQLKQENMKLKQHDLISYESKIFKLENAIKLLQQQKILYFEKCYKLQEENLALIHLNRQKEEIYQFIMNQNNLNEQKDIIVKQFQRLATIMFNNQSQYLQTLKKFGFIEENHLTSTQSSLRHSLILTAKKSSNLSGTVKNVSQDINSVSDFEINSNSKKHDQQLQIESSKKIQLNEGCQSYCYLQKIFGQLRQLKICRQKGMSFIKELVIKSSLSSKNVQRIGMFIHSLKKTIISLCCEENRIQLLKQVKKLETIISQFDFY